ncbi:MAG: LysR family transcriptional regulator [Firmicutes bacterium]|nr:LysR family transcriptional regulator [Bacillota bacterium]
MDINRIREFLVLSEHLNYSKAANLLYITQPVLSRHIHDLEETFGGQLFIRDTHKVELTEFGALCAAQLKEVVTAYDSAIIHIRSAADTSNDALNIGFLEYAVRPFLSQFAEWFQTAHPNIEIDYDSGDLDSLTDAVLENRMDLAFVTCVSADSVYSKDLDSQIVYEDRLLAVVSPRHDISSRESVSLQELSTYPLINYSKTINPHTADFHKSLFEKKGLQMQNAKEVTSFESGMFYAKAGIGVSLIPQHLSFLAEDLITVPISDDDCTVPLNLIWKKQNPKQSLQTFVHDFKTYYQTR